MAGSWEGRVASSPDCQWCCGGGGARLERGVRWEETCTGSGCQPVSFEFLGAHIRAVGRPASPQCRHPDLRNPWGFPCSGAGAGEGVGAAGCTITSLNRGPSCCPAGLLWVGVTGRHSPLPVPPAAP